MALNDKVKTYLDNALHVFVEELANTYPDRIDAKIEDGEIIFKEVQNEECEELEIGPEFIDKMYGSLKSKYSATDEDLFDFFTSLIENNNIQGEDADKIKDYIDAKNVDSLKESLVVLIFTLLNGGEDE